MVRHDSAPMYPTIGLMAQAISCTKQPPDHELILMGGLDRLADTE